MEANKQNTLAVIQPEASDTPADTRAKIVALEAVMLQMTDQQVDIPLKHYFAPGLYLREMYMPKDVTITGKIHKTEHYCLLTKGAVTVVTETGREHFAAPAVIHALPGAKRVIYAHEDVVWVNVHHNPTNERDLDKIEEIFIAPSFEALEGSAAAAQLEGRK